MKNRKKEETKVEKSKGFSAIKQEKQGSLPNLFMQWNTSDQYLAVAVFETSHEYAMINRL
jgi:hypothetical protein